MMVEDAPRFPVEPLEVKKRIQASEIREMEPRIVDLRWIEAATPISTKVLTEIVFFGDNEGAKNLTEDLGFTVYEDREVPSAANSFVFVVSRKSSEVISVLRTKKRFLKSPLDIEGGELFIANTQWQAIDVRSLLPTTAQQIRFAWMLNLSKPNNKENQRSEFGYDSQRHFLTFDTITDQRTLASLCHEVGHIWAEKMGIDVTSDEQQAIRKGDKSLESEIKGKGWSIMSNGISQVLFSERVGNLIAAIIAQKIEDTAIFSSLSPLFPRSWRDAQEAEYDKSLLLEQMGKFPNIADRIKSYLISRFHRTTTK